MHHRVAMIFLTLVLLAGCERSSSSPTPSANVTPVPVQPAIELVIVDTVSGITSPADLNAMPTGSYGHTYVNDFRFKVDWTFLSTNQNGDEFHFVIDYQGTANLQHVDKVVTYSGQPITIVQDAGISITLGMRNDSGT